jgi:hypothetical protein
MGFSMLNIGHASRRYVFETLEMDELLSQDDDL